MQASTVFSVITIASVIAACSDATSTKSSADGGAQDDGITHRSDITPVTRVEDAKPGVFIPPFEDCRDPIAGEAPGKKNGKVCTNVSIAGATEGGRSFGSYASCGVVLTQRPYYAVPAGQGATTGGRTPLGQGAAR